MSSKFIIRNYSNREDMKNPKSPMRAVLYFTKEHEFSKKKSKELEEKVNNQGHIQRLAQICKMCQEN